MDKPKQIVNTCLSYADGARCTNIRPFGTYFCSVHMNVCKKCKRAYVNDKSIYCDYCLEHVIFLQC